MLCMYDVADRQKKNVPLNLASEVPGSVLQLEQRTR